MCSQLTRFGARKGAWAVVTGATDGIGKEFASQLAKSGFNIILVARNKDLLSQSAAEIGLPFIYISYISSHMGVTETKYKVSTATHSIDFSKSDEGTYARFSSLCEGRDIGVLGTCFKEET